MSESFRETDLYPPVKKWLESGGYSVRAEVEGCDVAASKGSDLILIEMKRAINLDLLLQLTKRQETHASVYAAVPQPKIRDKRWRARARLLRRLEAGLLTVQLDGYAPRVQVEFHPMPYERKRNKAATRAVLSEMAGRTVDLNTGGSARKKLVTRYREEALSVLVALSLSFPASPKELRARGASAKAGDILRSNHYGWFEKTGKAQYIPTANGAAALTEYAPLVKTIRSAIALPKM